MRPIDRETWIEDLVDRLPDSVGYLIDRGMKPLACGEPVWLTIEGLARTKGMSDREIDLLVADLAEMWYKTENA